MSEFTVPPSVAAGTAEQTGWSDRKHAIVAAITAAILTSPFSASEAVAQTCERTTVVPAAACAANLELQGSVVDAVLGQIPELPIPPQGPVFDPNAQPNG